MNNQSPIKIFIDAFIVLATFVFNAAIANVNWPFIAIAIGGSLSGSIVFGYFRRDKKLTEQIFKITCAAISGVVIGAAADEWVNTGNPKFSLAVFFISGFVSLALLRATLQITERQTLTILRDVISRILGLPNNGKNGGKTDVD
jgi:hypothetical protein